jgi:signal transduction histidine kinase
MRLHAGQHWLQTCDLRWHDLRGEARVTVSTSLVDLASKLVDPETRPDAAVGIARELGADSIILFMRDQPSEELSPVPGFAQGLLPDRNRRFFFQQCVRNRCHTGEILLFGDRPAQKVYGMSCSPELVLLVVGTHSPAPPVSELEGLLPLIALALRGQRRADKASEARSEFLTTMSHELRTPLNAIGGYVQLLQLGVHGPLSDAQRDALDRVHRSQQHLLHLINDILTLARIESGGIKYNIVNVDLTEVAQNLLANMEPEAREKKLAMRLDPTDVEIHARADREKLDQILTSLVSNAIKFTSEGGRITIRTAYDPNDPGCAVVEVSDTGHGIPAAQLDQIFHAFVQLHTGLTRAHEGSGLGLAISRDLARGMNGDVTVTSKPGVGSTFKLELPAAPAIQPQGSRRRATSAPH